jgi:hypothetical protein
VGAAGVDEAGECRHGLGATHVAALLDRLRHDKALPQVRCQWLDSTRLLSFRPGVSAPTAPLLRLVQVAALFTSWAASGQPVTRAHYRNMMLAYCDGGAWREATTLLATMRAAGEAADDDICNELVTYTPPNLQPYNDENCCES